MKANDLMTGDWVCLIADDSNECLQVSYVRKDGVGFNQYSHFFDEIEPIPLTEEILEANGFVDRGHAGFQRLKDELCDRHLTFYMNGMMFGDGMPYEDDYCNMLHNIKYVHELQHALRLCGLNDLADNFKLD